MDENPCRHFLRGKCAHGAGCLRSHEITTNEKGMGAFSTYSTDQQRSEAEALNSDQTFSVASKDDDNAVVSEDKVPCSLYLMGQCTVEGCEFDHPGEKVTC